MLVKVRTPTGATGKCVLQLEATIIEVKNMYLHRDSNPGLCIRLRSDNIGLFHTLIYL